MKNAKCFHGKAKMKLVSWAYSDRYGHTQGFTMKKCCALCGALINSANKIS